MQLTLVRHGESTWNTTHRWQGQTDVPLSPRGRVQAHALAARLCDARFDRRLCSDLSRAVDTAAALGPAQHEARLREIDVGAWAGLEPHEVAVRFPDELAGLKSGLPVRIGGGESMPQFEGRVDALVEELREHGGRVLAVTHGGVIRAIATRVLGLRGRASPLVGVGNVSMTRIAYDGHPPRLEVYNDAMHVEPADLEPASMPEPTVRAALIAADPAAPPDRRLADALLAGLGIARIGTVGPAASTALVSDLVAEPMGDDPAAALDELRAGAGETAFALVLVPAALRALAAARLGLTTEGVERLALPSHGSVTQLRLRPRSVLMHSYAVPFAGP